VEKLFWRYVENFWNFLKYFFPDQKLASTAKREKRPSGMPNATKSLAKFYERRTDRQKNGTGRCRAA
jgi:hypothetical protein